MNSDYDITFDMYISSPTPPSSLIISSDMYISSLTPPSLSPDQDAYTDDNLERIIGKLFHYFSS